MEFPPLRHAPLDESLSADVCVVGAGIAGLSTAYLLSKAGLRVIVLEAGDIGSGETGRTTAHLSNALDDRYTELERVHGIDGTRLAAESHTAAIDRIESIVQAEQIDCGFTRVDGYLARHPESPADVLTQELSAAHRAGLASVVLETTFAVPSFSDGPILRFPNQAQFHPLRYLNGLARVITDAGSRICCQTRVRDVRDGSPAQVVTTSGHTVNARAVVVATNSPISDRVAIHTKQAPYRTYAVAFSVDKERAPVGLFWDTGDPYHYVRCALLSSGETSLIVGGADHKTGQADDAEARFNSLEEWTRQHFPMAGAIQTRWSGQVMEPVDHLAFIGRDVGAENVYIATGDSGHGMTHGTIAGMLLTDLILERPNPWVDLYAPQRKSSKTVATYAKENLNVAKQFSDYVRPGEVASVADIPPGSGALLRKGARLIAVYRDEQQQLHARSAVCTHVGCAVHWNDSEKSWDCPCHGSRFDVDGVPLAGPAREPLAEASIDAKGEPA